jgi:hypothetical protein
VGLFSLYPQSRHAKQAAPVFSNRRLSAMLAIDQLHALGQFLERILRCGQLLLEVSDLVLQLLDDLGTENRAARVDTFDAIVLAPGENTVAHQSSFRVASGKHSTPSQYVSSFFYRRTGPSPRNSQSQPRQPADLRLCTQYFAGNYAGNIPRPSIESVARISRGISRGANNTGRGISRGFRGPRIKPQVRGRFRGFFGYHGELLKP